MNRYNFISAKKNVVADAKSFATAKKVSNIAEILKISKSIGEYTFIADDELTKFFKAAKAASITVETLPNGNNVNRMKVETASGNYRLRVFGTEKGNALAPKVLTADELKNLSFGFCESDGEKVSENRIDGTTGEVIEVPVMYANVANL